MVQKNAFFTNGDFLKESMRSSISALPPLAFSIVDTIGRTPMVELNRLKKLLDASLVTDYLQVSNEDAMESARSLAREEGIFGGFSAGANLAGAMEVLKRSSGKTVAFLICDSGLKYLSTDLYPWQEG